MGPMGAGKGIIDVGIREIGYGLGEGAVIGFFTGMEPKVLENHDLAVIGRGYGCHGVCADAIGAKRDFLAQTGLQSDRHWL